ncbi:MAG: hypothetical protein OXK72_02890, partial [Gammaproteobacteria bacterium]|nr:hypothetical protein [Gammaproteobacteria bacterium]
MALYPVPGEAPAKEVDRALQFVDAALVASSMIAVFSPVKIQLPIGTSFQPSLQCREANGAHTTH